MSTNVTVVQNGGYTDIAVPIKSEDYRINLFYVLPVVAVLLCLIWWRIRAKKRP